MRSFCEDAAEGQLEDSGGQPLVLDGGFAGPDTKGLWGIALGTGQGGAGTNTLFFATGINDESDGLFGAVNMGKKGHGPPTSHPAIKIVQAVKSNVRVLQTMGRVVD